MDASGRISLSQAFSPEFVPLMETYVELVVDAAGDCDLMVLVARKALCLYYALRRNGELEGLPDVETTSSRALDRMASLEGRRVGVVDDVMIHGDSLSGILAHVEMAHGAPAVTVASASDALLGSRLKPLGASDEHQCPVRMAWELPRDQVYRLSREMVGYVAASGVPNNVDQPIFRGISAAALLGSGIRWADLTPDRLRGRGTSFLSCVLDEGCLDGLLGDVAFARDVRAKARAYVDGGEASLLPFVFLPPVTRSQLVGLAELLLPESLRNDQGKEAGGWRRSLYRALHYCLALRVGERLLSGLGVAAARDTAHERMIFAEEVDWESCPAPSAGARPRFWPGWGADLRDALPLAKGVALRELVRSSSAKAPGHGMSYLGLERAVRGFYDAGDASLASLSSVCVDSLVDRGLLVPCLGSGATADGTPTMERRYRGGEAFTLTQEDLEGVGRLLAMLSYGERSFGMAGLDEWLMGQLAAVFLRWWYSTSGGSAAPGGLGGVSAWRAEFEWSSGLLGVDGVSLVELAEAAGYYSREWTVEEAFARLSAKTRYDSACEKFASDIRSLFRSLQEADNEQTAPEERARVRFAEIVNFMLVGVDRQYLLGELRASLARVRVGLEAIARGGEAPGLGGVAEYVAALASPQWLQEGMDQLASDAGAAGIQRFDIEQYCSAAPAAMDEKLYAALTDRAARVAERCLGIAKGDVRGGRPGDVEWLARETESLSCVLGAVCADPAEPCASVVRSIRPGRAPLVVTEPLRDPRGLSARARLEKTVGDAVERAWAERALVVCVPADEPYVVWVPGFAPLGGAPSLADVYPASVRALVEDASACVRSDDPVVVCLFRGDCDADVREAADKAAAGAGVVAERLDGEAWIDDLRKLHLGLVIRAFRIKEKGSAMEERGLSVGSVSINARVIGNMGQVSVDDHSARQGSAVVHGSDNTSVALVGQTADWRQCLDALDAAASDKLPPEEYEPFHRDVVSLRELGENEAVPVEVKQGWFDSIAMKAQGVNELLALLNTIAMLVATALGLAWNG